MLLSTKRSAERTIEGFKSVAHFLGDVVDASKSLPLLDAVKAASPWLEAIGSSVAAAVPPVKFVLTLFQKLTSTPDPQELAELAFTISYEHAMAQALAAVGSLSCRVPSVASFARDCGTCRTRLRRRRSTSALYRTTTCCYIHSWPMQMRSSAWHSRSSATLRHSGARSRTISTSGS